MKPFKTDLSIIEYYKHFLSVQGKKIEKSETKNDSDDIFNTLHENKFSFLMSTESLVKEILVDKKISFIIDEDYHRNLRSVELVIPFTYRKAYLFKKKGYKNYADIIFNITNSFDKTVLIKIYDKSYMKFCEKLSKYILDFYNVNLEYEGPKEIHLTEKSRKANRKFIF